MRFLSSYDGTWMSSMNMDLWIPKPSTCFPPKSLLTPSFPPKSLLTPSFSPNSLLTPSFSPNSLLTCYQSRQEMNVMVQLLSKNQEQFKKKPFRDACKKSTLLACLRQRLQLILQIAASFSESGYLRCYKSS